MTSKAKDRPSPLYGEGPRSWLDIALGIAFALGGAGFYHYARGFSPMMPNSLVGPGLLPSICAVVFMVFGALLAISGFRGPGVAHSEGGEEQQTGSVPFMAGMVGGILFVVLLMPSLGFAITAATFGFFITWMSGARWWGAMISSVIISVAVYYLFSSVLRVPLPLGVF